MQRNCKARATARRENAVLPDLTLPSRSISYAKKLQTRGKRACSIFPECSISYAKKLQGESNGKTGKHSFTGLDTAEPKHFLCKDTDKIWFVTVQRQKIRVLKQ